MESALKKGESAAEAPAAAPSSQAAEPAPSKPAAPPKPAVRTFTDMRMRVGDRAQLEPPSQMGAGRVPVKVVGWVDGHSLIVSAPRTSSGRLTLQAGENVMLRVFTGSCAYAFKSTVLKATRPPFEYLHLTFPDRIEGQEVRASSRYRVNLPATAVRASGGSGVDAKIDNISTSGALVESLETLGAPGEDIRLEFAFELHGVPAALKLDCTIRTTKSVEDASGELLHQQGVSFKEAAPNDTLVLRALVWFEMYEHPKNAV